MLIRILLADDEQQFADALAERLALRNYQVVVAYGGEEALQKAREQNFDVAILDVYMPDKSGLDVLREIKAAKPLTEVLMLTGHAEIETAIEGMKAGAFDFLIKPAESDELFAKIEKAHRKKADHEEKIAEAKAADYFSSPLSVLDK